MTLSNLSDRGTLRGTLQRNSGNYNDLINKPAINGHTLIGNQSGHALGLANEDDIIFVEANPLRSATADLHKILVDDTIYSIPDVVVYGAASGAIASFDDGGDNKPLKSLKVSINPVQSGSGEPSPSNVRPISGWNAVNVTRCGKNLFDYSQRTDNKYLNVNTGAEVPNNAYYITPFIPVKAGQTVYIPDSGTSRRWFYNTQKVATTYLNNSSNQTFTPQENGYIRVSVFKNIPNATIYQIELGSTATAYEPYIGTDYTIQLGDTYYGGKLNVTTGVLKATWAEVTIDENTNIVNGSSGMPFKASVIINGKPASSPSALSGTLCNQLKEVSQASTWGTDYTFARTGATSDFYFKFDSTITTVEACKQYLTDNPLKVVYELKESAYTTIQLTPTQVKSLLGNNNLWSDTGEITECVYQRDLNIAINKALSQ